jgi:hypothetical protein
MVVAAPPRRPLRLPPETANTQRRLDRLAELLDSKFRIPGTGIRFGYDSLVGLLPGVGDTLGVAVSAWLIYEAWRIGTPRGMLLRMAANAGIDYALGSVPVVGDVFDIFFKANRRNVELLNQHMKRRVIEREKTENSRASLRRMPHVRSRR